MIIGGKFCASRVPFLKLKRYTISMSYLRQLQCAIFHWGSCHWGFSLMYTKLKIWGAKNLRWPCKPGGALLDCRGKQTGGETVGLNNGAVPNQQCSSSILSFTTCFHTDVPPLRVDPALPLWSDDSGWARGRRIWIWGGRKVPKEPLAFALPSLVKVILLVTLLACSLVVVILFQVPYGWPAVFLKVLLVLCIRINCLRSAMGGFRDKCPQWFLHVNTYKWSKLCFT